MTIPDKVLRYKPFGNGRRFTEKKHPKNLTYVCNGEKIEVLYWQRYPKYDFIFGYPAKGNRFYGSEAAFFQYRDTRKRKVQSGFYLDLTELKQFVEGFSRILRHHKKET